MGRCVVLSPRHAFIRPWIRAYFASGNSIPLVIVPGPPGDWTEDDYAYCKEAARFSGGIVFDCSSEWRDSKRLAARAVRQNVGWYTKKSILRAVATRLAPKSWAWIDDDAEVTGNLDECFDVAERSPGFILAQFYYPNGIDNRHPERLYRSRIDPADKVCWNSLVFFHGEANGILAKGLAKEFPVEDDEIVFGYLYKSDPVWRDGFCDFSIRMWQTNCKLLRMIPKDWDGKLLHYTANHAGGEVKKMWAAKADILPPAPFERSYSEIRDHASEKQDDGPVDAVFVIGTGSVVRKDANGAVRSNEELRYALRNIERNCPFVRDVYICGYCPEWVDKSVVKHLNWKDRFSHAKDANIIDKLRHACEHPGIAKRILFCSDDQFQTRVCSWDDFAPRYLRKYSPDDGWYEGRRRIWHSRLRRTLEREAKRRREAGLDDSDVYYYQPHIWMPIDRDMFVDYARWCGYAKRDDTIIASGYYNFAGAVGRPDFDHVFIGSDASGVPSATHVAYHDGSYDAAMGILRKMFPNPCRFELKNRVSAGSAPSDPSLGKRTGVMDGGLVDYGDPSKASASESARIRALSEGVRSNPAWHGLLGEISRAEELRLFGVRGWRIVWNDIILRWKEATRDGTENTPVGKPRSPEASEVLLKYMQNPESMRTVRFGPQGANNQGRVWVNGRKVDIQVTQEERNQLRDRVRASLRRE